jgi:uncharacterized protein (TIGR02118 family)
LRNDHGVASPPVVDNSACENPRAEPSGQMCKPPFCSEAQFGNEVLQRSLGDDRLYQIERNLMHRLLVLYNEPKDPAHFRKHYVETHVPLASKMPGVKAASYSFDAKPLGPGKTPYFCVFEADFESEAALMNALGSKEGQAVAGDVPNYASGGVTMVHFPVK